MLDLAEHRADNMTADYTYEGVAYYVSPMWSPDAPVRSSSLLRAV